MPDQMLRKPLPPLATGTRIATGNTTCGICGRRIAGGSRETCLLSGQWVHLWPCLIQGRPR